MQSLDSMERSACHRVGDSETLSSTLNDSTTKVSHRMQTNTKVAKGWYRQFSFTRKILGGMKGGSIQVCAAWTVGSLIVV